MMRAIYDTTVSSRPFRLVTRHRPNFGLDWTTLSQVTAGSSECSKSDGMSQGTTGAELIARVQYSYNYGFSTRAKVILTSKYCTAIFNSAGGVTCDPPAEILLPADPEMTCDQSKISAGCF